MPKPPTSAGARFDALRARIAAERVRGPRSTVVIGRLLALAFVLCFLTGLYSHVLQDPPSWLRLPTRPVRLYQVTQGVHVASGFASVPLLLGKLWIVYPRLFDRPLVRSWAHLVERVLIGVLVAASLLELVIGVMNVVHWYAWPFSFRPVHHGLAWVIIGALLAHIGFRLPTIAAHWRARPRLPAPVRIATASAAPDPVVSDPPAVHPRDVTAFAELDRRMFIAASVTAASALVVFTLGQSTALFSALNVFGPRRSGEGPQSLPINRTAAAANVLTTAVDPGWTLDVTGPGGRGSGFDLARLCAMEQTTADIPISCVEGWSTTATWTGVRLRDVLTAAGIAPDSRLRITSLQTRGGYRVSEMGPEYAADGATLIALRLNGEVLTLDHGYPARIIAPGRPGVLQTKWLSRIEVIDR